MKIDKLEEKLQFYSCLDERRKRQFAGLEAISLGHGGIKVVSESFGISVVTIRKGKNEIENSEKIPEGMIRHKGGGRKKTFVIT